MMEWNDFFQMIIAVTNVLLVINSYRNNKRR